MSNNSIQVRVLKEIQHPKFIERIEHWTNSNDHTMPPIRMHSGYSLDNKYIGDIKDVRYLVEELGITPESAKSDNNVCSIGFSDKDQKWYGWSHRAKCGYSIGDKLFEKDFGDDKTPFIEHGRITIENMAQARQSAINFADSVS